MGRFVIISVVEREDTKSQTDYIVTVTEASPEIKQFQEYNQSNITPDDYFDITEQTHIYQVNQDGSKILLSPVDLKTQKGSKIEFWISPNKNKQWDLFAIEINVLD